MNKKLLTLIGGSVLSAMLIAGCATDEQEPPPEDDTITEENGDVNGGNGGVNGENGTENGNMNGDPLEDENTEGEEMIEDQQDIQDENNKDQ
ncbi:hypothetical protein [Bacillus sp. J33]|uniref:hypothetical protein n=1 Tax=Bacillus sp. J33 TaxID=935836 RepID=UPI00047D38E2|nr:hypothetical protein [Bacillus sp. J33]